MKDRGFLITEKRNKKSMNIDCLDTVQILKLINKEDENVFKAVKKEIRNIAKAVEMVVKAFQNKGRLFYVGAGTSGRLGVLDASECPPTFGIPINMVKGIIAGGGRAITRSIEGAEDNPNDGAKEIRKNKIRKNDVVMGIATGSTTPFVLGALKEARRLKPATTSARRKRAGTIFLSCNPRNLKSSKNIADVLITPIVGPEVVTGSTRMKAGTATKLVLNMITTTAMIKLGKVYQNLMVDLQVKNKKLQERSIRIIVGLTGVSCGKANNILKKAKGNLKVAIIMLKGKVDYKKARKILEKTGGVVRKALMHCSRGL